MKNGVIGKPIAGKTDMTAKNGTSDSARFAARPASPSRSQIHHTKKITHERRDDGERPPDQDRAHAREGRPRPRRAIQIPGERRRALATPSCRRRLRLTREPTLGRPWFTCAHQGRLSLEHVARQATFCLDGVAAARNHWRPGDGA